MKLFWKKWLIVTILPLGWFVNGAKAGFPVTGPDANKISSAETNQLVALCEQSYHRAPLQIMVWRSRLGYRERKQDPEYFPLVACAYLSPDRVKPRFQIGIMVELEKSRYKNREQWAISSRRPYRWILIERPHSLTGPKTKWYNSPFPIGDGVRPEDAVAIVDFTYRDTLEQPGSAFSPDLSVLEQEILGIEVDRTSRKQGGFTLKMNVGNRRLGSWQFATFRKYQGKWQLEEIGISIE